MNLNRNLKSDQALDIEDSVLHKQTNEENLQLENYNLHNDNKNKKPDTEIPEKNFQTSKPTVRHIGK